MAEETRCSGACRVTAVASARRDLRSSPPSAVGPDLRSDDRYLSLTEYRRIRAALREVEKAYPAGRHRKTIAADRGRVSEIRNLRWEFKWVLPTRSVCLG